MNVGLYCLALSFRHSPFIFCFLITSQGDNFKRIQHLHIFGLRQKYISFKHCAFGKDGFKHTKKIQEEITHSTCYAFSERHRKTPKKKHICIMSNGQNQATPHECERIGRFLFLVVKCTWNFRGFRHVYDGDEDARNNAWEKVFGDYLLDLYEGVKK